MKDKRNLRVMGLALVAVFLLGAVGAASASAALPEFKAPGGFPVKFSAESGAGTLETVAGRTVTCKKDKATGEVGSATEAKNIVATLEECTTGAFGITFNCGTITSNTLKASPHYLTNPNTSTEVGLDFLPVSGTEFAKFTCTSIFGNETLAVKGSAVGKITPINKATKSATLTFAQTNGKQKYEGYFVGATFTKDTLETTGTGLMGFGPEQSAIERVYTVLFEKEIEIAA
jgi:hypothetical protein